MGFDFSPADIIIPIIFLVWVIDKIKNDRQLRLGKIGKMVILFLFVLVVTYFINFYRFPVKEMLVAFSVLGRYGMYLILAPIVYDLIQRDKKNCFQTFLLVMLIISMVIICILGFLQLEYFPSFEALGLQLQGWDPHIGRLLSTWFDPNFIGGYLAFMLSPVIALAVYFRSRQNKKWFWIMTAISAVGIIALYLTYSRSGYLALIVALVALAFFKSRKLLLAGLLIGLLAFSFSSRVQERTMEAWDSGKAFLGINSQVPLDPTAELRVWSWKFALEMISENPWTGVGYSRYAYEVNQRGHALLSDHSAGGSDSSLLTIWATSGIFGLLSYLSIGFIAAVVSIKRIWKKKDFRSYLDTGLLAGFVGMMVHSAFVNSLLFSLMMVYLLIALGMMDEGG
jgi:O-antigen ligase